jgi:hypothetical protein
MLAAFLLEFIMSQIIEPPDRPKHGGGPKTPEGKARSAMNATRHGLTGETVVLPGEDPKQFEELLQNYIDTLKPITAIELDLVHEIAVCRWRIQRCWTMESCMFEINLARTERAVTAEFKDCGNDVRMTLSFMSMSENSRSLALLHRYETRITRRFHQAIAELKALQNQRKAEEMAELEELCQTNSRKSFPRPCPTPLPCSPGKKKGEDTPSPPRAA